MSILGETPLVLGQKSIANPCPDGGCAPYSSTFQVSRTETKTRSWEHGFGVEIMVGTEFSSGIPVLAEGKVTVEVTASTTHTWGGEETEEQNWSR